jgi:hypothetical protein
MTQPSRSCRAATRTRLEAQGALMEGLEQRVAGLERRADQLEQHKALPRRHGGRPRRASVLVLGPLRYKLKAPNFLDN